jgi:MoxR-like ATPase
MAALAERTADDDHSELLSAFLPPTQLADYLLPPQKRADVPFDDAWDRAMELIVWPPSSREAKDWRLQLAATREVWRAAYENWAPERSERAAAALLDCAEDLAFSEAA